MQVFVMTHATPYGSMKIAGEVNSHFHTVFDLAGNDIPDLQSIAAAPSCRQYFRKSNEIQRYLHAYTYTQRILPFANPGLTTVAFGYNPSNSGKTCDAKLMNAGEDLFNSCAENDIFVVMGTEPDKVTEI